MNKRVDDIIEEARKLTVAERFDLVHRLSREIDGEPEGTPDEIETAWVEEINRRGAAHDRGETTFIPAEEVMAQLRARIRRPSRSCILPRRDKNWPMR